MLDKLIKIFTLCTLLTVFSWDASAQAAQHIVTPAELALQPHLVIIYDNQAASTYDKSIDKLMLNNLRQTLTNNYVILDSAPYMKKLQTLGMEDLSVAERQDLLQVFQGEDVDYVIFLMIEPLISKERRVVFAKGKDVTVVVPFRVIDVKNDKYVYTAKFTERARDTSMIGSIGNKSVTFMGLKRINKQINQVLTERLPKIKGQAMPINNKYT